MHYALIWQQTTRKHGEFKDSPALAQKSSGRPTNAPSARHSPFFFLPAAVLVDVVRAQAATLVLI